MSVVNPSIQPVFDPENVGASIDAIRERLAIRAPRLEGYLSGEAASLKKGDGYDIDGVREYQIGDDPRTIDWKITARQVDKKLQVREHYREVTPSMWVVTDMLQSRHDSADRGNFSEQRLALSAIAGILRVGEIQGMPTATIASNDEKLTAVRQRTPVQGRPHLRKTLHQLVDGISIDDPSQKLPQKLHGREAVESQRPRLDGLLTYAAKQCVESIVVVVSDFRDTASPYDAEHGWAQPLRKLAKQGNDIIAIELTNPYDFALPTGVTRVSGTKSYYVDDAQRERYAQAAVRQQAEIDDTLATAKARHIRLSTTDPQWSTTFKSQLRNA